MKNIAQKPTKSTAYPEPISLTQIFAKLTVNGSIHPVSTGVEPSKIGNGIAINK